MSELKLVRENSPPEDPASNVRNVFLRLDGWRPGVEKVQLLAATRTFTWDELRPKDKEVKVWIRFPNGEDDVAQRTVVSSLHTRLVGVHRRYATLVAALQPAITVVKNHQTTTGSQTNVYLKVGGLTNGFDERDLREAARALVYSVPNGQTVEFFINLPDGLSGSEAFRADHILFDVLINQRRLGEWSRLTRYPESE